MAASHFDRAGMRGGGCRFLYVVESWLLTFKLAFINYVRLGVKAREVFAEYLF
jgi:hypothetical protein